MPSFPAKNYIVPHDDWFSNSNLVEKKSATKGIKKISNIHDFFYRQSDVKVGGSDIHIETNLEKKLSTKLIISTIQNYDEILFSTSKEKYIYYRIPAELKSIKKRSFKGNSFYKRLSNKNLYNFWSYLLNLKSVFLNNKQKQP